jgi:hypothetical protein
MARTDPGFMLRLPPGMRELIAEAAKTNNRSMNAEIVARLEQSLQTPLDRGLRAEEVDRIVVGTLRRLSSLPDPQLRGMINALAGVLELPDAGSSAARVLPLRRREGSDSEPDAESPAARALRLRRRKGSKSEP